MAFVYILRCSDGSFYTGSTTDLDARLAQHQFGEGGVYTRRRLPVELVWWDESTSIADAYGWERAIHGWSRAKKLALIEGRYDELPGWSARERKKKREADAGGGPGSE